MPKENVLTCMILAVLILFPATVFSNPKIRTSQHIIAIDPGHGGSDTGIVLPSGRQEKTLVLELARKTADRLQETYEIVLTRNRDSGVPQTERIAAANKAGADLFISIHLNHAADPAGFFYFFQLPGTHTLPAGATEEWRDMPLKNLGKSQKAAALFLTIFKAGFPGHRFETKSAPVYLLEGTNMPALLIEPFSISNLPQTPGEIDRFLDTYAILIAKGIFRYFQ